MQCGQWGKKFKWLHQSAEPKFKLNEDSILFLPNWTFGRSQKWVIQPHIGDPKLDVSKDPGAQWQHQVGGCLGADLPQNQRGSASRITEDIRVGIVWQRGQREEGPVQRRHQESLLPDLGVLKPSTAPRQRSLAITSWGFPPSATHQVRKTRLSHLGHWKLRLISQPPKCAENPHFGASPSALKTNHPHSSHWFGRLPILCSVTKPCPTDSLRPHGLQHRRLLCPLFPRVCSNLCPMSQWCYLTISSHHFWNEEYTLHSSHGGCKTEQCLAHNKRTIVFCSFIKIPSGHVVMSALEQTSLFYISHISKIYRRGEFVIRGANSSRNTCADILETSE